MKVFLFDSDILIDYYRKREEAVELVEGLGREGELTISVLSVTELRAGWNDQEAKTYLSRLYDIAKVIPVTQKIAEQAGKYRQDFGKKGTILHSVDAIIGTTAIHNDYWLVTRNIKDFPMPELKLYRDTYQ